ncbi:glycoside hydrolase family 31 protein [Paenibacillus sp. URB8-2]|uniref:glycoside hydrolase family 31 protein n=1 Tax=Paenibacillus sp. URB8-2 TaxID=2741301 RepID=UPI0015BEAF72|nr:glycoside hydrolase family 31 protein [Paenibacillus sp. URB8-2]BCG57173.1 alpha-glucosidase [Paenibacillus sp. URB8-2]
MKRKRTKKAVTALLATAVLLSGNAVSQFYLAQPVFADDLVFPVEAFRPTDDRPLDKSHLQQPMTVQSFEQLDNGVKLNLGAQEAYIRMLTSDMAKVSLLNKGDKEYTSVGIAKTDWSAPKFKVKEDDKRIVITTDSLTVDIKKSPFGIKYMDKDGNVINEDGDQGIGYENGKPYVFKKTDNNENFYGLGEKTDGLNKRGKEEGIWHQDPFPYESKYIYQSVPFFIGLKDKKAYGILFDNTYRTYYNFAKESDDYYYFYADGGKLTYYFFNGPQIKDVVDRYTDLTGKIPLPPEWSLGFHQSSWAYSQNDMEEVAAGYREKKIPADGLFFDIEYMDDYKAFTWGKKVPDPAGLGKRMEEQGFHQVNIFDPAIRALPGYSVYDEGTAKDLWVKNPDGTAFLGKLWPWNPSAPPSSVYPNFLKKETRDWWSMQYKPFFDTGIDGIWNDVNEPVSFIAKDHWTLPLDAVHEDDNGVKHAHEEVHNIYAHLEEEASYNAFKKLKPNVRPFVLTRAGYTGTQRYAATWTGDNHSTWEHLRMSIPMNANVGLAGHPFVGNDIGGFTKNKQLGEICTPELFARWLELGAFLPFSRDHYNNDGDSPSVKQNINRQEPWQFGKEVEDISRKYISMRYELMPYLQNAFKQAHETGNLIQQPLVFQFQDDPNTYNNEDQFMFGDSLMIAPVVEKGATSRSVYLPAGVKWIDYWTGEEFEGGQTITKQADLGTLPLYVKQGSIIPRREVQQYAGEKKLTNLTLDTYLNDKASYSYYQDDATTEDYTRGEFNVTDFHVENKGNHVEFEQDKKVQNYASDIQSYTLKLHDAVEPKKVQAANNKYAKAGSVEELNGQERAYYFDANEHVLYVKIPVNEKQKVKIQTQDDVDGSK